MSKPEDPVMDPLIQWADQPKTPAGALFAAAMLYAVVKGEVTEMLLKIAGFDQGDNLESIPCEDVIFDDYDDSFEFMGTRPGWKVTPEMLTKFWALGFDRCWVRYGKKGEPDYREEFYEDPHEEARQAALWSGFMERYRAAFQKGVEADGVPSPENYEAFGRKWGYPYGWTEKFVAELRGKGNPDKAQEEEK